MLFTLNKSLLSNSNQIGPDDRWSYELAETDTEITGIVYRAPAEGEVEEIDYLVGTDEYALIIEDNPLLQGGFEAVLSTIYDKIGGFAYRPLKFETIGYPHLWPGDKLTKIIDAEGSETASIITNHLFKLNGKSTIEARGETETVRGYATGAPFTPKQKRVLKAVARVEAARQTSSMEHAALALNELMVNSLGYYSTTHTLPTGARVTYTHDQPLLEESEVIWTRTELGFAWTDQGWNEGDPDWQYGVSADGSMIVKLIIAAGIQAEWLDVEDLSAITGKFTNLMAGDSAGARLEMGEDDGAPFLEAYDSNNKLRVKLLQDRLAFSIGGVDEGNIIAEEFAGASGGYLKIHGNHSVAIGALNRVSMQSSGATIECFGDTVAMWADLGIHFLGNVEVNGRSLTSPGTAYTATLQNGWTGTLQYSINVLGQVWLRGLISPGTTTAGTTITTLPVGYRPTHCTAMVIYDSARGVSNIGIKVLTNGQMNIRGPGSAEIGPGSNVWVNIIYQTVG